MSFHPVKCVEMLEANPCIFILRSIKASLEFDGELTLAKIAVINVGPNRSIRHCIYVHTNCLLLILLGSKHVRREDLVAFSQWNFHKITLTKLVLSDHRAIRCWNCPLVIPFLHLNLVSKVAL